MHYRHAHIFIPIHVPLMTLYIKNMVCNRCIAAVVTILTDLGLKPLQIHLGEVTLADSELTSAQTNELAARLLNAGFELIDDRKGRIIERIKNVVVNIVHHTEEPPEEKYSELISAELHYDYSHLSKLFSEVEGTTIEQFVLAQKAEKIKEYLVYDELSLGEIAVRMGYKSVAHLSAQFRKVTGLSPSHFKKIGAAHRRPLDKTGNIRP